MASTTTTELGLFKPIPGTAEPFRTTDVNNNWDILDGVVAGYEERIAEAEASLSESVEQFEIDGAAAISSFNVAADAALDDFAIDSAAALAAIDTDAIITTIVNEGFSLDIDGGTA
jgi:hypothetical protein